MTKKNGTLNGLNRTEYKVLHCIIPFFILKSDPLSLYWVNIIDVAYLSGLHPNSIRMTMITLSEAGIINISHEKKKGFVGITVPASTVEDYESIRGK